MPQHLCTTPDYKPAPMELALIECDHCGERTYVSTTDPYPQCKSCGSHHVTVLAERYELGVCTLTLAQVEELMIALANMDASGIRLTGHTLTFFLPPNTY